MGASPIYFILKPQPNQHSTSPFSASSLVTVILAIYNIAQSKVYRELANLGVSHTNVEMNEGYATQSKSRTNSPLHGA